MGTRSRFSNFVQVGSDPSHAEFVEASCQRGRRLAYLPTDEPAAAAGTEPDLPEDLPRLATLAEIPGVPDVDFLLLSGDYSGRAERLVTVLRGGEPTDLAVAVPVDEGPTPYYEAQLAARQLGFRLFPLSPELLHPAVGRLSEILGARLVQATDWTLPLDAELVGATRFQAGWSWLLRLAGDVEEVSATGSAELGRVLVAGRTVGGTLHTVRYNAQPTENVLRIELEDGSIECALPDGLAGSAQITSRIGTTVHEERVPRPNWGELQAEEWARLSPDESDRLWNREARRVEIGEAIDRSLTKGRPVALDFDEISEESGFKGIMAGLGCGLIWFLILVVFLAEAGVPLLHYLIPPMLVAFLLMQVLGAYVYGRRSPPKSVADDSAKEGDGDERQDDGRTP